MVQSLREKHPASTGEVPQWVRDFTVDTAQWPSLATDILARAIHTATQASAAGPSGWATEHLRDTFLTEPSCLSHLLEVFNQWVAGQVPERARPWLAASNLVRLSKLNDDVRPVAIGEVLPRILARALCISLRPAMVSYFLPCNQLGAGTRVGAEILTHSLRSALATHPDCLPPLRDPFHSPPIYLPFTLSPHPPPPIIFPPSTSPLLSPPIELPLPFFPHRAPPIILPPSTSPSLSPPIQHPLSFSPHRPSPPLMSLPPSNSPYHSPPIQHSLSFSPHRPSLYSLPPSSSPNHVPPIELPLSSPPPIELPPTILPPIVLPPMTCPFHSNIFDLPIHSPHHDLPLS
ncbi:unnamed protein product [Closterium sp. NIES-64]|nr:unnamed protein product [Closterium sp. NIES-64]